MATRLPVRSLLWLAGIFLTLGLQAQTATPPNGPQSGQKIIFYGDSIMQVGNDYHHGFIHLVEEAFQEQERPIVALKTNPAPNNTRDLLSHLPKDVLALKPDWLALSYGYYDSMQNVTADQFKTNLEAALDQAAAAGIKILLMTSIMNGEDPANPFNQKMVPYNDAMRAVAKEKGLPLADVNADMQAAITQTRQQLNLATPGNLLTNDPTHVNGLGQEMIATSILKAFGFTDPQIAQARDIWLDMPGGMDLVPRGSISVRQYLRLRELAAAQGLSVNDLLAQTLEKDVLRMLTSAGPVKKKAKQTP